MADDWDAALDEIRQSRDEGEPETPLAGSEPPVAQAAPADPAAPAAPPEAPVASTKIRVASLDDVIIDDPRLPQSLLGQSGSALLEERSRLKYQHDQAGFRKNELEAEAKYLRAALEVSLRNATPQPAAPEPAPKPTLAEVARERIGDPKIAWEEPDRLVTAAAEVGAEYGERRAIEKLTPEITELKQKIAAIDEEKAKNAEANLHVAIRESFAKARPADVSPEKWFAPANCSRISAVVYERDMPVLDPQSYVMADQILFGDAKERLKASMPTPAAAIPAPEPAPAPSTAPAPAPPAPPVGANRTAPVQQASGRKPLGTHEKNARDRLGQIFGFDTNVMDEIEAAVVADPKTRGAFQ